MKRFTLITAACLFWLPIASPAQRMNPIRWTLELEPAAAPPGATVLGRLTAKLEPGWHLYSLSTPRPPIATTIALAGTGAVAETKVYTPSPSRKFDPNFGVETETFDKETVFLLAIRLAGQAAAGDVELTAQVRYQACTDKLCLPPVRRTAGAKLTVDPSADAGALVIPAGYTEARRAAPAAESPAAPAPAAPPAANPGLLRFLLVAFGFGLAAIFTPCVFPMIPITVSFFLNRESGGRGEAVRQAAVFCLGIVVLFSLLGLVTTAALGPFGVVLLGSNPWVNTFIALVFAAFAFSLLGAFEITLPSGLLTRLDGASRRGGFGGALLMGLTFTLTAFACVGPFVGTLLAASVGGGGVQPLLGMASFASGLALPFFVLALFPSWLQRLPKSGGWMARVKIVLGFVILAAAFKYLSNVDQVLQWHLLTRERFLAIWVVLFALPGLYLLGFLRMEGVRPEERLGVARLLAGAVFLIFAVTLIPGMWGGSLGELDAYVPLAPRPAGAPGAAQTGPVWMKNRLDEALARAKQENKLVFVSFTGYACTNCHWMKANMFSRADVEAALGEFVLVELYTDGTDDVSRRNQDLQEKKFSTIAIPYYAILDADQEVVATHAGLTRDAEQFLAFLGPRKGGGSSAP